MSQETAMSQSNGFTQNADLYRTSKAHSEIPDLDSVADRLPSLTGADCLDVATGTGHTAFFLARKHAHVFAVDINDQMLRVAQEESDRQSLSVRFLKSPAEELMFDDDNFDLVTCRLAAHHFPKLEQFLAEAARVLRIKGHLLVVDNVVPEDEEIAKWLNDFESARDRTHQKCLSESQWKASLEGHGFEPLYSETFNTKLDYKAWMERMSLGQVEQDEMWQRLMSAPTPVRDFWSPIEDPEGDRFLTLRRQIMLSQLT
jgi:ubiquinone/menaquinone biosynthesis C-methylase UbiE